MTAEKRQSEIVKNSLRQMAFTLPEVIISFSVLAMVITSAVSILSVVMRTNSDNVSSLIANGLAQEGLEAVRFIRDSNVYLGLGFDGAKKNSVDQFSFWGEKLYEDNVLNGESFFKLVTFENPSLSCDKLNLKLCLPVSLVKLEQATWQDLSKSDSTLVYLDQGEAGADAQIQSRFRYFQTDNYTEIPSSAQATAFHRMIRIQPVLSDKGEINSLRINSIVTWEGINGIPRKVVLTTNLTDWR